MSKKDEKPAVEAFRDHEVITPVNKLVKAMSIGTSGDLDPVARAELALAELSTEFSSWMDDECTRLDGAREAVRRQGLDKGTRDGLFRVAHDIKGQAATFGFPQAAEAADSLCRLIEHAPDLARIPVKLVDQHVDAIRAIVRENARPDAAEIAVRLSGMLREVSTAYLLDVNKDRAEALDAILAPSIAPDRGAA